jgi:hypothetical protein
VNVFGKLVNGFFVVFDVLTSIDFSLSGFNPGTNIGPIGVILFFFLNEAVHSLILRRTGGSVTTNVARQLQ